MLSVGVVEDLAAEPVTLAEAKAFLVIDAGYTEDDTLLTALIKSARQLLEKYTNLSFGEKTLKAFTDKYFLDLPYGPIIEVTGVVDQDDEAFTDYTLKGLEFKKIYFNGGNLENYYQRNKDQDYETLINTSHTVTYTAGYGAEGGQPLPEALKLAIKEQVQEMYNKRGAGNSELSLTAKILADPYARRPWL